MPAEALRPVSAFFADPQGDVPGERDALKVFGHVEIGLVE
jgi:hypothetical protein